MRVADVRPSERIVVPDEARILDPVQQHVRRAQHVRKRLLLDGPKRLLHELLIFWRLHILLAHVANRAGEESSRPACWVQDDLAGLRVDTLGHERRHRSRRVVLAGVSGTLEVVEDLLVDIAEVLLLGEVIEVDFIDLVDDLPQQLAGLHVVVRVLEDVPNDTLAVRLPSDGAAP